MIIAIIRPTITPNFVPQAENAMENPSPENVTQLLKAWSSGDRAALDELTPLVYEELRRLAHRYMSRERTGHTLQTTALVNEAYLKLVGQKETRWENRAQFFGLASQVMRNILVDYARTRSRSKRGGAQQEFVSVDELEAAIMPEKAAEILALDEALRKLEREFPRKSRVVELRYFGGLSVEETAEVLKISPVSVMRDWNVAKAWLYREMNGNE